MRPFSVTGVGLIASTWLRLFSQIASRRQAMFWQVIPYAGWWLFTERFRAGGMPVVQRARVCRPAPIIA